VTSPRWLLAADTGAVHCSDDEAVLFWMLAGSAAGSSIKQWRIQKQVMHLSPWHYPPGQSVSSYVVLCIA